MTKETITEKKGVKLNLQVKLTDQEVLHYGNQLANSLNKKGELENTLANFKTDMKAQITKAESEISMFRTRVHSRKEYRDVECKIIYDWKNKTKVWVRLDTGEEAKSDIIPESEYQEKMDGLD